MKRLTAAALFVVLAAPPAFAVGKADLEPAFKNTIVSTYPDGRTAKLWLNADGSYRAQGRRGKPSSGRWTLKGERICLSQKKPVAAPLPYCTTFRTGGIGTSWPSKAVTGERIRITLVAGR